MLTTAAKQLVALILGVNEPAPDPNPARHYKENQLVHIGPDDGDPSRFHPTKTTLEGTMAGLLESDRRAAIQGRVRQIALQWERLDADPITGPPLRKLQQVRAVAGAMPAPLVDPLPDGERLPDLGHGFRLDETEATAGTEEVGNKIAWSLVVAQLADMDRPVTVGSKHTDTPEAAAKVLQHHRRLQDILHRLEAACRAWDAVGGSLATVLAFYRTEGNLAMPPSRASLDGTDVGPVAGTAIGLPPGRSEFEFDLNPRPDLTQVVYVVAKDKSDTVGYPEARVRDLAQFSYYLAIAGLDDMVTRKRQRVPTTQEWLALNRPEWLLSEATERAWKDYSLNYALLDQRESKDKLSWVVVPTDPVTYVSRVLYEGVRFMRQVGTLQDLLGPPSSGPLPPLLQYLDYHAGVDRFRALIFSALVAARSSNSAHAAPLKTAIGGSDQETKNQLASAAGTMKDIIDKANANWGKITGLLRQPGIIAALDTFVGRADATEWNSWLKHRSNGMRYERLYSFYRNLFPTALKF